MDVSEESIDSECNLFELPANEEKIGKTRAKSALGQNTHTGLIRRCRRKANPQPEIAKDLNASATLEGKVTHGRPKGGKTSCGEVPPAKKQKLDTLEQTQDSGNIETAKGSALTCEGEPASSKTKHVENNIVTNDVQFEGQTGDCQHRSKKIKVEATSLSPSYKHIWKNDTSLKTNVNQCHFNENCFICNICNVTSPSKESYKKHISSVRHKKQAISTSQDTITKEGFNCRLCGHLLPSRYDLDKHIKENHSKRSKAHICPQCKFKAESAALLQAHLKHKHFQKERLSCDLCGYQCYDENLLKTHCRGKTHLRRKNLAARGGYIHLLSKKGLSGECGAKDKVRNAKLLNKRPGNLRKTRNRCLVQKDAKQSTECLGKSTRIGNNLCVEEGNSNKMPMANDQIELNDCHAGKASPRRTLRSIKEPSNLLQERGGNQRLRRSGNGNVSWRLRSARCKVNSEHSQSTRSRLSKEEVANRKSPRKLQRRANLSTKNNSRSQGQFPHKREVFPEAQQKSGSVAGSKNGDVKETSKPISQESNQLEGKSQNQSKSTDMTLTDANLEDENAFKISCSSDNQEGASTPSEIPNSLALVENNIESTSGDQNLESPSANPTNTKASKVENTESKLSPADRKALRTCSYCGHLFQNRKGLEVHIKRRHTKEMVFHCQPCGYACVTKGDFEKHCQSNRHQLNFSKIDCWLCTFVTSDEETLKDHMNQKHKIVAYCRHCKVHFVSKDDLVDHVGTEQHARNMFPQQKETTTEQTEKLQPRELELNKTSSSDTKEESTVQKANPLIDPQKPSITRVVAGNILKRSTHSRTQLQCKHCFYKARSASVLLKHIRLRHAQEYRFYCKVCSLYTISKEAMEKHIKRTRHIMNAKKQSLGPSVEECIEEVSVGVWDIQKTMKTQEALGNVNTEIDKGYVQVLEPSKPKEEFVVTWEIPEGDTDNVEDAQKNSDLQSTGSVKRGRPKGNISRTCLYCGLLASSVTNLNIHIRRKHSHQYSYFCKTCNYYTVTKGDMDRHCNTKKHKNQVDVSKTELCRKIATSPDKDHPQVIVSDVASVSMAEDVQNGSKGLKPETPDVKNQSGNTENCTRVNLESFPSTQVQQKMENQNEIVVVLDVESNDMGQNGSSSNSKPRKENHTTTCVYCGFMAYSLATLEMHVKRKHTKDFDYYCMACAYYAVTRREMMRHAITEKHKLKSRSYLKLNLNKGRDSSTVLTVAPENEHQKEGNEHQMDEGSWNEEGGISKASQDAFQKSVSSIIETEKAVEDSEVVSAAKETAAVSKMAENQVKSLQNEVAEEEENIQTLSAVCYSEISSETYSGILEANTAHSNAPLDIESHAAELKSVSLESAVLETIQNQISQSPNEQDSSSFYKDIVTSQKTNVKNNNIDLHVEASQTEEDDFQQLSEAGESGEDEQNVKPAEVAKEISSSLDSRPNEMVDPGQNHPNNYDIEEEENMEEGLLASTKDVEGSSVQGGCHLQPGKNSEHIHVNRVQQIDSNYQNIKAVSEEMSVQGDINPPHDFGGSENFLDDQNKGEADLKEKAGDMKSANENSQELEITESTGDNLKLDLQGKGFQKYFEFDASIVRLKNKFGSEKSECTDNSEDSQGADGVSPDEWAVAVYKTDTSQVMKKRKNKGSLFQYPKRIRCEDCGFLADGVNGLNVHIAMKHPSAEKHFHCFLCGKSFYTESNLHQHLASMGHQRMEQESIEELPEGGATFKCVKCNTAFDLEEYLFVHIKQKHGEMLREVNKYIVEDTEQINCERQENQGNVCKYCGKVCKSSNSLAFLAHIRTHTGSKPFRCTLCNFATAQLGDARNHVKRHLGVREYKCHICGWAFVMKKHLSTHLLGKHGIGTPKERKFVCEICDRTFTEKWALTNHKKLHMGQKPFKCTWLTCHYSFLTASAMRDHFRTHTGEKSFLCDLCGFAGGTRHALTKHRRQHTGEKPFKCDQCNFASTTQSHLTRHRRVHTGEKPYKCPWCDYRSNCAENIRKHILHTGKHEGVQMYNCPKCDYGTNIPLEFRNHLKELHPDIENPDLAYLHAGIVSKAYECRLKGQGAQFVETAVPVNPPRVVSTEITGDSLGGCIEQQESADSIGQVFIIQGYQVGCGEEISIDTSVEATAAATLQTLAMVGQMTQVAKVMHITEDGQIIDTTQTTTHVSNMVPEQTVTQQPISDATQEAAGKEPTEQGSATEAAIAMETLTDSNQVERVVTQEDEAKPTSERPTALVALLCAVTEVGAIEARSAEQEGSESTQEGSYSVNSAIENVISTQKESVHEGTETFHKDQTVQETTEAEGTVSNIEQQISVTTTQEGSQVAFSDVVQEVLQFTMCDMRTTSHIVKDGVTRVIVAKEGTTHVVEGASQIIVQEGEEQTIATNGHPMRLVDSSGEISQIIITEEVLQAMVQETTGHLSEEATHVIVTEVPHNVVNGDHSRAVTEVYPQRVMELVNEDMSSSSQSVATVALAECYTEDRSEVVMIELPAKEEQEMEIDGIQEA